MLPTQSVVSAGSASVSAAHACLHVNTLYCVDRCWCSSSSAASLDQSLWPSSAILLSVSNACASSAATWRDSAGGPTAVLLVCPGVQPGNSRGSVGTSRLLDFPLFSSGAGRLAAGGEVEVCNCRSALFFPVQSWAGRSRWVQFSVGVSEWADTMTCDSKCRRDAVRWGEWKVKRTAVEINRVNGWKPGRAGNQDHVR